MNVDFLRITPKKRTVRLKRKNRGVLYSNPNIFRKFLFYGVSILGLGLFGLLIYIVLPAGSSYLRYFFDYKYKSTEDKAIIIEEANKFIEAEQVEVKYFGLNIPKILAVAEIKENVSPFESSIYSPILESGMVAHSSTSNFPGDGKGTTTYLFAHSSDTGIRTNRANSVFYLLGELIGGDNVWIERNGIKYFYKVYDKKIIKPDDIEYLDYRIADKEVLILQTCWPIGTNWNRLIVMAELMTY